MGNGLMGTRKHGFSGENVPPVSERAFSEFAKSRKNETLGGVIGILSSDKVTLRMRWKVNENTMEDLVGCVKENRELRLDLGLDDTH